MAERRFTDDEAAEIFRRAAEAQHAGPPSLPAGEGMTLVELQEIGREVGIPGDLVEDAARGLARTGAPAGKRFFGLPIAVGRTVVLDRRLTDDEWDRLVVELRETFHARGRVRQDGSLRQWTNGNLQALLEPTPDGDRLRLRTMNGNARGLMFSGLAVLGIALGPAVVAAIELGVGQAVSQLLPFALVGVTLFGVGALRLPRWARTRERQMEGITARLAGQSAPVLPSGGAAE